METMTVAIIAALANLGAKAISDAYEGLKAVLLRKFGAESKVAKAVEGLEQEPDSEGWKVVLKEAAEKAGADEDAEIMQALKELLAAVKAQPGGGEAVQQIVNQHVPGDGNKVIAVSGGQNVTITA